MLQHGAKSGKLGELGDGEGPAFLKEDQGHGVSLVESPWEGMNHRKGMAKQSKPRDTRHPNIGTKGEAAITKHLPYVQAHAWYWKEAVVEGKELRLWGLEVLSCSSAFALTSSVMLGRLLNISGPLACQVSRLDQVIQDVRFCPDNCDPRSCTCLVTGEKCFDQTWNTSAELPSLFLLKMYCCLQATLLWPSPRGACPRSRHSAPPFRTSKGFTFLQKADFMGTHE